MRSLVDLSHGELATLGREYLLAGQMIDRAGMPHLISRWGRDTMRDVAIDEWMGASPSYSRRMQRALNFVGTDVSTMFKGMQLDIGAPPEFMDFRYLIHDERSGEFWLNHCGALIDVEPMGDEYVTAMCHHIEDPTFEATACASNPRARMTPIHRPPRVPAERHPHCHWSVDIDEHRSPVLQTALADLIGASRASNTEIVPFGTDGLDGDPIDDRGWSDYSGILDPDMRLEDFSRRALSIVVQESMVQAHLLIMSFSAAIETRHGPGAAIEVAERQFAGAAGMTAGRLARALHLEASVGSIAQVFELHPACGPKPYVGWSVRADDDSVRLQLDDSEALHEPETTSWISLLARGHDRALSTIAHAVDPRARVERIPPEAGGVAAWNVTVDGEPGPESDDVTLTKFSSGATFTFRGVGRRADDR